MRSASTTGDIGVGICCCHDDPKCIPMTGIIVSGSTDTFIENIPAARTGDIVVGVCGHVGVLIDGSSNINIDSANRYKVGVNDLFVGCFTGIIVTGKSSTIISD